MFRIPNMQTVNTFGMSIQCAHTLLLSGGEGRAKAALNVSMVFKENIRTILKPMTVLCRLHAM